MIADAQITFLPSADLDRSRSFYEGVLGLPLVLDQGTCHLFKVTDRAFLGTCRKEAVEATEGVLVPVARGSPTRATICAEPKANSAAPAAAGPTRTGPAAIDR